MVEWSKNGDCRGLPFVTSLYLAEPASYFKKQMSKNPHTRSIYWVFISPKKNIKSSLHRCQLSTRTMEEDRI